MAVVTRSFDAARSYLGSFTWDPFVRLSRAAVLNLLGRVETGHILIIDTNGLETVCGERWPRADVPQCELKVLKDAFWVRLLLFADMVRESTVWEETVVERGADRCCSRVWPKASC